MCAEATRPAALDDRRRVRNNANMSKISAEQFSRIMEHELPSAAASGIHLTSMRHGEASLVLPFRPESLRPGQTIAGPFMMLLADVCMYAVVLSMLGEVKLAVTTSFNINFLRRPAPADLRADGSIIKLGKRLAVVEVSIFSDEDIVAHATGTYSIPPREPATQH